MKFLNPQKERGAPRFERDTASVLIFPEQRRAVLLDGREIATERYKSKKPAPEQEMAASHFYAFSSAFRKFTRTAGLPCFDAMDLGVIFAERMNWGSTTNVIENKLEKSQSHSGGNGVI